MKYYVFLLAVLAFKFGFSVAHAGYQFTVGAPHVFYHDTGLQSVGDSYFSCNSMLEGLICYSGNGKTRTFVGPDLESMELTPLVAISRGPLGALDECGAWLQSSFRVGSRLLGFYHGERDCIYRGDGKPQTKMSMFYAESFDGGLTFTKPPNNLISSSTYTSDAIRIEGRAGGSVVKYQNKLLMSVIDVTSGGWRTEMAFADFQAPSLFTLDKNGAPSIDGVGESDLYTGGSLAIHRGIKSMPLVLSIHGGLDEEEASSFNLRGKLSVNGRGGKIERPHMIVPFQQKQNIDLTDLERPKSLNFDSTYATPYGGIAFRYYNTETRAFERQRTPPLVYGTNIDWANRDNGELFSYPSIVGYDQTRDNTVGGKDFSDKFWLVYTYAHNGESFVHRRILTQLVSVKHIGDDDDVVRSLLTVYQDPSSKDRWATAKLPLEGYEPLNELGYIFTEKTASRKPLYEYRTPRGRHLLATSQSANLGKFIRISGWVENRPTNRAQMALVRRHNSSGNYFSYRVVPHAANISPSEQVIGYIMRLDDPNKKTTDILTFLKPLIQ